MGRPDMTETPKYFRKPLMFHLWPLCDHATTPPQASQQTHDTLVQQREQAQSRAQQVAAPALDDPQRKRLRFG